MKRVTFYSRVDCHLCDDALAAIERLRPGLAPFELKVVDLDQEAGPERRAAYTEEVPVVEIDGRKVMKYRVDEARFIRLMQEG